MPYTGNPNTDTKDEFRLLIGDTDPSDPIFSDGEVDYWMGRFQPVSSAALQSLYSIKAKYAHCVDQSVGGVSVSYSNLIKQIDELISALQSSNAAEAIGLGGGIYVGGISESDKQTNRSDSDAVKPFFTREGNDFESLNSDDNFINDHL